jgi:hypothetical protein
MSDPSKLRVADVDRENLGDELRGQIAARRARHLTRGHGCSHCRGLHR